MATHRHHTGHQLFHLLQVKGKEAGMVSFQNRRFGMAWARQRYGVFVATFLQAFHLVILGFFRLRELIRKVKLIRGFAHFRQHGRVESFSSETGLGVQILQLWLSSTAAVVAAGVPQELVGKLEFMSGFGHLFQHLRVEGFPSKDSQLGGSTAGAAQCRHPAASGQGRELTPAAL